MSPTTITVGTTPVALIPSAVANGGVLSVGLTNSGGEDVRIGDSNVTSASGFLLKAGESIVVDLGTAQAAQPTFPVVHDPDGDVHYGPSGGSQSGVYTVSGRLYAVAASAGGSVDVITAPGPGGVSLPGLNQAAVDARVRTVGDGIYVPRGVQYRPAVRTTKPTSQTLSGGTGNTVAGVYGSGSITDASTFALGSSAATITTNGAGAATWHQQQISPSVDLTGKIIRLFLRVSDYTNVADIELICADAAFTDYYQAKITEGWVSRTSQRVWREGEWLVMDVPRSEFVVQAGTPNWNSIGYIRILFNDKNGVPFTLDYNGVAFVDEPSALPNGAVVISLDDSDTSHWTKAKPYLDKYGVPAVLFPICSNVGAGGLSVAQLQTLHDYTGCEIGAHAWDDTEHAAGYTGLTDTELRTRFDRLRSWAAGYGFSADVFAWPNGDSDTAAEAAAKSYFSMARGTCNGTQPGSFPLPMRVRTYGLQGASLATVQGYIDKAKSSKGVASLLAHQIIDSGATGNQVLTATFQGAVDYAVAQGVPILTFSGLLRTLGKV